MKAHAEVGRGQHQRVVLGLEPWRDDGDVRPLLVPDEFLVVLLQRALARDDADEIGQGQACLTARFVEAESFEQNAKVLVRRPGGAGDKYTRSVRFQSNHPVVALISQAVQELRIVQSHDEVMLLLDRAGLERVHGPVVEDRGVNVPFSVEVSLHSFGNAKCRVNPWAEKCFNRFCNFNNGVRSTAQRHGHDGEPIVVPVEHELRLWMKECVEVSCDEGWDCGWILHQDEIGAGDEGQRQPNGDELPQGFEHEGDEARQLDPLGVGPQIRDLEQD